MFFNPFLLDLTAAVFAVLSTVLASLRIRSSWLLSFVACGIYSVIFFSKSLYFNLGIHAIYLPISVYGAIKWYAKPMSEQPIRFAQQSTLAALASFFLLGLACLSQFGPTFILDYTTSYLSIAAMMLMSHQFIECWILWILADLIYIKLYISSHMYFSMVKSCGYLLVASFSYYHWYQQFKTKGISK